MCQMLLSINPKHANNILSGSKKYEYRKVRCRDDVDKVIIYATSPQKEVVGEASISEVIEGEVADVWNKTKEYSGITERFFNEYYYGKKKAIAYKLTNIIIYDEPLTLADLGVTRAPQSYQYINV